MLSNLRLSSSSLIAVAATVVAIVGCSGSSPGGSGGTGSGGQQAGTGGGAGQSGGMGGTVTGGAGTGSVAGNGGSVGAGGTSGSGMGGAAGGAGAGTGGQGAACNSVALPALSTCSVVSSIPVAVGGTIVPGLYELRSWATTSSCPSEIQGAFRLTATGTDTFRGDAHQIGNGRESITTFTLMVDGTNLHETFTCGLTLTQTFSYTASVAGGVTQLDFMFGALYYTYIRVGN